jgi:hypothetical protein
MGQPLKAHSTHGMICQPADLSVPEVMLPRPEPYSAWVDVPAYVRPHGVSLAVPVRLKLSDNLGY